MAKVRWTVTENSFHAGIRNITSEMESEIPRIVEDAVKEGAEAMQEAIAQDQQTQWVGRGPYATQGRQDSGDFRKDIKHDVEEYATSAKGEYGWIEGKKDYYMYQEHGFTHWITTNWIPGVQSLYHGAQRARAAVVEGIRGLFK